MLQVLRLIDRTRIDPVVCSLFSGGRLRDSFVHLGIPVVQLGVRPGLRELLGLRLLPVLLRYRPHIVHSRLILSNLWARLGFLVGAKVICEERSMADGRPLVATWLNRTTQFLSTTNVANAEAVAHRMRTRDSLPAHRLRVIHGGVDLAGFAPAPVDLQPDFDLIAVTRLEPNKGVLDLLSAMELVVARAPGATLAIVGNGSQREALERAAREKGLGSAVTFWGERLDVPRLLHQARVFVAPSHDEGLPNRVLEAMSCGLPVVATAVGGTPESVVDHETGRLVEPRNPSALAEAILQYLEQPWRIAPHGAAGRQRVLSNFNIERTARAYQQLYFELASSGTRPQVLRRS